MADPRDSIMDGDTLVDEGVGIEIDDAITQARLSRESMEAVVSAVARQKALDEQKAAATVSDTTNLASDGIQLDADNGIQLDADNGIQLGADDGIIFNDITDNSIVFNEIVDAPMENTDTAGMSYSSAQDALDAMAASDTGYPDMQGVGYDDGSYKVVGNENNPAAAQASTADTPVATDTPTSNAAAATSMEDIGKAEFLSHAYNYAQNNKAIKNADGWVYHFYNDTFGSAPTDAEKNDAKLDVANNPKEAPDFFLEEVHARHQQYHQNLVVTAFQSALSKLVDDKQRKQVVSAIKKEFLKPQNQDLPKNISQKQKNHAIANKVVIAELGDYSLAKNVINSAAKLSDTNSQKEKAYSPFFKIGRDTADVAFGKLDFGGDTALKGEFKQALDKLDKPMQTMAIQSALGAKGGEEIGALMADSISKISSEQSQEFVKELGIKPTPDPANTADAADPKADSTDPKVDADATPADKSGAKPEKVDPKADADATPADKSGAKPETEEAKAKAKAEAAAKANTNTDNPQADAEPSADTPDATPNTDTNTDEAPENTGNKDTQKNQGNNLTPNPVQEGHRGITRTVAAARAETLSNVIFGGIGGIIRASGGGLWDVTKAGGRATVKAYNNAGQQLSGQNATVAQGNIATVNRAPQGLTAPDYQSVTPTHPHIVAHQTNINNYANYMNGVRAGTNAAPVFRAATVAGAASLVFLKGLRQLRPIPQAIRTPRAVTPASVAPANQTVNASQVVNVNYALNNNAQAFINTLNQPAPAVTNVVNSGQMFTQVNNGGVNPMSPLLKRSAPAVANVVNSGQMFTQVNNGGVNPMSISPLLTQPVAPAVANVVNSGQMFTQVNNGGVNPMSPLNSVQKNLKNAQKLHNPQQPSIAAPAVLPVKKSNYFDSLDANSPIHHINDKAKTHLMKLNDYSNTIKALPTDGTALTKSQKSVLTKTAHDHLNSLNSFRLSLDPKSQSDVTAFSEVKSQIFDWHKDMEATTKTHGVSKKDSKKPDSNSSKLSDSLESTGKALSSFFNSVSNALNKFIAPKSSASNSPKPR